MSDDLKLYEKIKDAEANLNYLLCTNANDLFGPQQKLEWANTLHIAHLRLIRLKNQRYRLLNGKSPPIDEKMPENVIYLPL